MSNMNDFPLAEVTALDAACASTIDEPFDPFSFTKIIVACSGGKDSLASLLHLLDIGIPKERIELWHHDVDGREGSTLIP